jgi:endonuclease III-like uncharacterized protein
MEKRLLTVIPLMGIIAITMFLIQEAQIKELRSKIANQELEMKEKQNMINSYAEKHLKECECNCGWYEQFYYEHSAELGAFE